MCCYCLVSPPTLPPWFLVISPGLFIEINSLLDAGCYEWKVTKLLGKVLFLQKPVKFFDWQRAHQLIVLILTVLVLGFVISELFQFYFDYHWGVVLNSWNQRLCWLHQGIYYCPSILLLLRLLSLTQLLKCLLICSSTHLFFSTGLFGNLATGQFERNVFTNT